MPKSDEDWKKKLTPQQYNILREKGTEMPFTGKLLHNKEKGAYTCAGCGSDLFNSETKFDSGTGWPSFYEPKNREKIEKLTHSGLHYVCGSPEIRNVLLQYAAKHANMKDRMKISTALIEDLDKKGFTEFVF